MSNKQSRQQLIAIFGVVVLALLGVIGYLVFAQSNKNVVIEKQQEDLAHVDSLKSALDVAYNDAIEQMNAKIGENDELNELVEQQKGELKKQKQKIERMIRQGKGTQSSLADAKAQIDQLIMQRDQALGEITQLQKDLNIVIAEKEILTTEKAQLEKTIVVERETAAENEKTFEEKKKELEEEKTKLSEKVAKGSLLKTSEITVNPQKVLFGKYRDTKSASKAKKLIICFTVNQNRITQSGTNKVLIKLISPLGETVYLETQGAGEFANQDEGGSISRFTIAKEFDYDNQDQNICIDYMVELPLTKGTYTAEIYNKGYLAGKKEFTLK